MDTYSYIASECGKYVYRVNNNTKERETIKEPKVVEITPPLFPVLDIDPSLRRGRKRPKQIVSDPVKIEKPEKKKPILENIYIHPSVRRGRGRRPKPSNEPYIKREKIKVMKITNSSPPPADKPFLPRVKQHRHVDPSTRRGRGRRIRNNVTDELVLLEKVKDVFNSRQSTEIILNNNKPVLSFIMPWFRAKYLGWLPLEALCRQIDVDFDWELIIIEENLEDPFGLERLKPYSTHLKNVNCSKITYISLKEWIPLSCKWYYLIKQCDKNSKIIAMNPHDIYFPNNRLHKQYYTLINSNYNWYKTAGNILYDIQSNKHARYNYTSSDRPDTCLQTAKKEILDKLPLFYKTRGIDGERYKYLKNDLHYYYDTDETWINHTINVNGLNNLSRGRVRKMNDPKEYLQLETKLHDHMPWDISYKLKLSYLNVKEYKNLVNNSDLKLPKYY